MSGPNERLTLTVPEAAQLLGVARNSLYYAIQRGEYKDTVLKVGNRILISRAALLKKLQVES
jgi:excisionase family DNA binding protein